MADNILNNAINQASALLNSIFGDDTALVGPEALRYLDEEVLADIYEVEIKQKGVSKFLSEIPKIISATRSSYLPVELISNLGTIEESLSEIIAEKESYENTFMRLIGLPDSAQLIPNVRILKVQDNGTLIYDTYENIESDILDQRQLPKLSRQVLIDNSIYNTDESSYQVDLYNQQDISLSPDEISPVEISDQESDFKSVNLADIESDLFKFSYLLFPPIQDSRISGCINEPDKIIAPKFSKSDSRIINTNKLKTTLLESIIRIRLDKLSGTNSYSTVEINSEDAEVNSNSYGILEALFIIRLKAALSAIGRKLSKNIDEIKVVNEQTGMIPLDKEPVTGADEIIDSDAEAASYASTLEGPGKEADNSEIYDAQRSIEDAIFALLDDNSKISALDLELNTQRKSTIIDSPLMGSILGIIDLPRKRIAEKIKEKESSISKHTDGHVDKVREEINVVLGVAKGIGAVDILVFTLALFTIPENYLVGLLDNIEYKRFLDEFSNVNIPLDSKKMATITAVNKLTEYIYAGYKLFETTLKSDDSGFDFAFA